MDVLVDLEVGDAREHLPALLALEALLLPLVDLEVLEERGVVVADLVALLALVYLLPAVSPQVEKKARESSEGLGAPVTSEGFLRPVDPLMEKNGRDPTEGPPASPASVRILRTARGPRRPTLT